MKNEFVKKLVMESLSDLDGIAQISEDTDLYELGMTSLQTVTLMLAIEDKFNIHFPHTAMGQQTFQSINAIVEVLEELTSECTA